MPAEVAHLAESMLRDPVRVSIAPVTATMPKIDQLVHFVSQSGKRALLGQLLAGRVDVARDRVHPHQAGRRSGGR